MISLILLALIFFQFLYCLNLKRKLENKILSIEVLLKNKNQDRQQSIIERHNMLMNTRFSKKFT